MEIADRICRHLTSYRFEDFPLATVERAKTFLLDSLGVAIAGTTATGTAAIMDRIKYWGGRKESSVFVFGGKVPAYHAALMNGVFCHARELDDGHEEGGVHTFAAVLPAALAVAEEVGGVSGKDFLTALILGTDLTCRLGLSIRYNRGWHFTGICGASAAASFSLAVTR